MTQTAQNFKIWSGDHKDLVITIKNSAGTVVDITGVTLKWILAAAPGEAALVTKLSPDDVEITDGQNGVCKVHLIPADTASLAGVYYHEMELTDTSSNVSTTHTGYGDIVADLVA